MSLLSFAKTPSGEQVVDLSALIRRESLPADPHTAPLARAPPIPVRRPPTACPRDPRLATATGLLQAADDPAQTSTERSPLLGRAVQGVARLEASPRHRGSCHRAALAATPLSPPLGHALRAPLDGAPPVDAAIKALVRRMAAANPLWGAPRIHGELLKLGIDVAERTVSRLLPKRRSPPSQTWRTFLTNHVRDLVSIDFFTVPTARLLVLFVFVVLAHDRRRVLHFNVTEHPTAAWTAQQIVDAFPDDSAPSCLLRDRDSVYGHVFRQRVKGMGVGEVLTAPHSPWQNPFAERLIGSIRRECLNHVLVLGERHLLRTLARYFAYYHRARTHLSLDKDAPHCRPIERPELGKVIPIRQLGGLHHRYVRWAA